MFEKTLMPRSGYAWRRQRSRHAAEQTVAVVVVTQTSGSMGVNVRGVCAVAVPSGRKNWAPNPITSETCTGALTVKPARPPRRSFLPCSIRFPAELRRPPDFRTDIIGQRGDQQGPHNEGVQQHTEGHDEGELDQEQNRDDRERSKGCC